MRIMMCILGDKSLHASSVSYLRSICLDFQTHFATLRFGRLSWDTLDRNLHLALANVILGPRWLAVALRHMHFVNFLARCYFVGILSDIPDIVPVCESG